MVSDLFDADRWEPVTDDFDDITYHRGTDVGAVRIAFDRPEVRNAFRPETIDELHAALDHAKRQTDVGCILLTGNGPPSFGDGPLPVRRIQPTSVCRFAWSRAV